MGGGRADEAGLGRGVELGNERGPKRYNERNHERTQRGSEPGPELEPERSTQRGPTGPQRETRIIGFDTTRQHDTTRTKVSRRLCEVLSLLTADQMCAHVLCARQAVSDFCQSHDPVSQTLSYCVHPSECLLQTENSRSSGL